MSNRNGIIDCGSNTFHILIFEIGTDNTIQIIHKQSDFVWLGKNLSFDNTICEESFERGIDKLKEYEKILREYEVKSFQVFGTAALRQAVNAPHFVQQAKAKANINIHVISGDREAELIYKGVNQIIPIQNEALIVDVGGISTEFIIANSNGIQWKKSYTLGGNILLEKSSASNPLTKEQINFLKNWLTHELSELSQQINRFKVKSLIGSSGSFDTLADVLHKEYNQSKKNSHNGYTLLDVSSVQILIDKIISSTLDEIINLRGMNPKRGKLIAVTAVLIRFLIDTMKAESIIHSPYALKEGALAEIIL